MSLLERLYNGISVQRKFTRSMAFIHVCYLGTMELIKIYKLMNMCFLWILGLSPKFNLNLRYFRIDAHILLRQNSDDLSPTIMLCKWCHSFVVDLFLIVNFCLLKATFKKDIPSIDTWLALHGIHFLYILLNIDFFTITYYYSLYICIYCIYLLLVISFRMEERDNSIFHKIMNYFCRLL